MTSDNFNMKRLTCKRFVALTYKPIGGETIFQLFDVTVFSRDFTSSIFSYCVKDYRYRLCGINYRGAYHRFAILKTTEVSQCATFNSERDERCIRS